MHDTSDHPEERQRVFNNIHSAVLDFCRQRLADDPIFHASDLQTYVMDRTGCAPASPQRIMQLLRAHNRVDYKVLSRPLSRYQVYWVDSK
jgi:hypothetical protein